MLPSFLTSHPVKATLATVLALGVALTAVSPAQALGRNERNFIKGAAAAVIVDRIIDDVRTRQQPRYYQQPQQQYYAPPVYQQPPVYVQPPAYAPPPRAHHVRTTYQEPRRVYQANSIYSTPAAQAFNAYTMADRKRIQQQLSAQGYYRSGIDGSFGPGTYNAILAYANDRGQSANLSTRAGVFGVFDGLVY